MKLNLVQLFDQSSLILALMSLNNACGSAAAGKALGEITAEARAAAAGDEDPESVEAERLAAEKPGLDRHNQLMDFMKGRADAGARVEEQGGDREVTMAHWCAGFAATNEALINIAHTNQAKWPTATPVFGPKTFEPDDWKPTTEGEVYMPPRDDYSVLGMKIKQGAARPKDNAIAEWRASANAFVPTSGDDLELFPDDKVIQLLKEEAESTAKVFSAMYAKYGQEIASRLQTGIGMYQHRDDAVSWETIIDNLPDRIKLGLLKGIYGRLDAKVNELFTGRLSDGVTASKGATRPRNVRTAEMLVIRADQRKLKELIAQFAHEAAGPETSGGAGGKGGTPIIRASDGPAADAALAEKQKIADALANPPDTTLGRAFKEAPGQAGAQVH